MSERSFRRRRESPNKRADDDQLLDYQDDADGIEEESFLDYPDETLLSEQDIERHKEILGLSLDDLDADFDDEFIDTSELSKFRASRENAYGVDKERAKKLVEEAKSLQGKIIKVANKLHRFPEMFRRYERIKGLKRAASRDLLDSYEESWDSFNETKREIEEYKADFSEEERGLFKMISTLLAISGEIGYEWLEASGNMYSEDFDITRIFMDKLVARRERGETVPQDIDYHEPDPESKEYDRDDPITDNDYKDLSKEIRDEFRDQDSLNKLEMLRYEMPSDDKLPDSVAANEIQGRIKKMEKEALKIASSIPRFYDIYLEYLTLEGFAEAMQRRTPKNKSDFNTYWYAKKTLSVFQKRYPKESRAEFKKFVALYEKIDSFDHDYCKAAGKEYKIGTCAKTQLRNPLEDIKHKQERERDD